MYIKERQSDEQFVTYLIEKILKDHLDELEHVLY